MGSEILDALSIIAKEKAVDPDYLLETLKEGILAAAEKRYRRSPHLEVHIDQKSGEIRLVVHMRVVKLASDLSCEIDLEEALEIDPDVREGDVVPVEVPVGEFGRNAISAVKQSLVQHVREAERKNVYDEYIQRVGQIITGTVQQADRGSIIVRLGRSEAIIPAEENIRRDRPMIGDHIRALLVGVDPNARGPQVILSRTRPEFVIRLFEQEVPEVYERIVEIRAIAREAGARTKIAVVSHDDRVDPVGACVGVKGSRVQNIVKALGGERIDIIALSSDPLIFVSRALSPARVLSVSFMGDPKTVRAVVPDDQLSLAIGKGAQNVRLAGQLAQLEIQLVSQSQQASLEGRAAEDVLELDTLTKELGPKLVERLVRAGKETLQDVLATPVEELMEIQGIGEKTASKLVTVGAQILEQWTAARKAAAQAAEATQVAEAAQAGAGAAVGGEADAVPAESPEGAGTTPPEGGTAEGAAIGGGEAAEGSADEADVADEGVVPDASPAALRVGAGKQDDGEAGDPPAGG
ncbi:MAG: transcription termination/antitermination protein NusA [Candidatus Eisenbacteria bacterium]|uniref:Transcription termination/antitermination protein NusA n=1 Tax=Eiseniibacteriota bacterium TaxID=2212470 RepID=A0A937XBK5_UNCEI|nr:transcription termination/antitermination protein NusA [Candidatus Eisenbacteria bacterium]